METEALKLIGGGSAQLILAAGYVPVLWLVRALWADRKDLNERLLKVMVDAIEAERDMTKALDLLAGKIGK